MAEPTPYAMATLFSQLVGRDVKFTQLTRPTPTKAKQMYGVYAMQPSGGVRVVQADLPLLGSFAGALVGLPSDAIKSRLAEPQLDESLRDAVHEVLNVASTVVSIDARAVFQAMYNDPIYCPEGAGDVLRTPLYRSYFQVAVDGYDGGAYALFA